jgi:xanthine dehydrogenase accessory factor
MAEFWERLLRKMEEGNGAELVSVLETGGSTPRGAGALMAVFTDGTFFGTVGGGSIEYEAIRLAKELARQERHDLRSFHFVSGDAAGLDMACGGDMTLHFHYLDPQGAGVLPLLRETAEASRQNQDRWLLRRLQGAEVTDMVLTGRGGVHSSADWPEDLLQSRAVFRDPWFALPVAEAGRVLIFGGGHVSQALSRVLASVGFRPVIYDDRPEFTAPELFPEGTETICGPFETLHSMVTITEKDDVVIMTRGHRADETVLVQTLRSAARYIGCIGSRRKLALCREHLLAMGFTAEEYGRVHAPIGLAIGAETPAEIAVSVAAELIAVRAGLPVSGGAVLPRA